MRLTHSFAARGLAVGTAGAALFASAMLGTGQVANASVDNPAGPDQANSVYHANGQVPVAGTDDVPRVSGEPNDVTAQDAGTTRDATANQDGDAGQQAQSGQEADQDADAGQDGDESNGRTDADHHGKKHADHHGKKHADHHGKKHGRHHCRHDGMSAPDAADGPDHNGADAEAQDFSQHWSHDADGHHDAKRSRHCHMPRGGVESGRGGTAVAAGQSTVAPVSLGVLSALLLGAGAWVLARARRLSGGSAR